MNDARSDLLCLNACESLLKSHRGTKISFDIWVLIHRLLIVNLGIQNMKIGLRKERTVFQPVH